MPTTLHPSSLRPAALSPLLGMAWVDNQAIPVSATTLMLAALLILVAVAALGLAWLLQAQASKTKRLQAELLAQRTWSKSAMDALPALVLMHGPDGDVLDTNIYGRQHPAAAEAMLAAVKSNELTVAHDGEPQPYEIDYTDDDGMPRQGMLWNQPLLAVSGERTGSISFLFDITAFRDAEQAARVTERGLREIVQRVPVAVFSILKDTHGIRHVTFAAGDIRALFGLELTDLLDTGDVLQERPLQGRIHPDDVAAFGRLISPVTTDLKPRSLDFRAFGREGLRWIHGTLTPQALPDGSLRLIGYFIDTTELNARNEALRIARDVAERASKAKADFLATMSHEIRTPMNGVIGMLELLGRTPVNAEQRELLRAVEDSASVLLQILNDILDFSKLEAGDLRLDETPFDPRVLVDNVVSVMASRAQAKGLGVHVAIDATVAGSLLGDSVRLRQILLNLLSNATKFTERGSIAVRVVVLADDGAQQHLRVSVSDTGIGIPREKQATLFNPFTQAEASTSRRYGGTGLGLAICRHLVQLMEGSVELSSEPGRGTTVGFEVRLPVERREAAAPPGLRGRHAVVRLGSTDTGTALSEHLKSLSMTVELADSTVPLREGMAASLLFVEPADTDSETRISAHVVAVTDEPLLSTGIELRQDRLFLSANPLKWQSLVRACLNALELRDDVAETPGSHPSSEMTVTDADPLPSSLADLPTHRGHVLVAEDHPVSQKLILRQLAILGLSCDVVDNGRDAFEALSGSDYAMLLTDCNMPLMSGYELATAWRKHEAENRNPRRLPIIAMTANALAGEAVRVRNAGMDDVLSKPLQLLPLSQKISQWLPEQPASASPPPSGLQDLGLLTGLVGGDEAPGLYDKMLQAFSSASHDDLLELRHCVESGDTAAAALSLHRLLGALQLFSNGALLDQGRRLLEALHSGQARETLPHLPGFAQDVELLLSNLNGQPADKPVN
ncbi:Signal transduction histidine kinase [Dyella sp. OK004]|uniref:hybrid sensor histidine kinase/response regulator n=1 Tax=Dyella sp. OK004 TaxID=1855292 RepID=UPI0008EC2B44|nr:ATP-binding protein [Dyella sp. OK004]SFS00872.1 Signal transduction histidine kinase [Dyella sp. OK004]